MKYAVIRGKDKDLAIVVFMKLKIQPINYLGGILCQE